MARIIPLALLVFLSACVTAEERAALDAADDQECIRHGAPPGTAAFTRCRGQLAQRRRGDPLTSLRGALQQIADQPGGGPTLRCESTPGLSGSVTTECR